MNTIDKILIGCAVTIIVFTITMVVIFCIFQDVPSSLIDNFYNLFTGETIITFLIWWIKKKGQRNEKRPDNKDNKP